MLIKLLRNEPRELGFCLYAENNFTPAKEFVEAPAETQQARKKAGKQLPRTLVEV